MTTTADRPIFAPPAGPRPLTPLRLAQHLARIPDLRFALPVKGSERTWLKLPTDAGWDAWLIGWPPGARTGWHDHQGSAGAFVLLGGSLTEWSVPLSDAVSRTAGATAVHAERTDVRRRAFRPGAGRQFADHHIHDMANHTDAVAYSVHAYAPELTAMAAYAWVGEQLTWAGLETADAW